MLTEVLPYLGIEPSLTEEEAATLNVAVGDYRGLTVESAKAAAQNAEFSTKVIGSGDIVTEQLPRYGGKIPQGGIVILYTAGEVPAETVTVPDVTNYTPAQANRVLINAGLNISMTGAYREDVSGALAVKQSPEAGSVVQPGTVVEVEFRHMDSSD